MQEVEDDLKGVLTGLCQDLFGKDVTMRWNEDYFPFTTPSFEVEVWYQDKWLEVLGCGIIHEGVLKNAGVWGGEAIGAAVAQGKGKVGWAFGLGLERLAMVLFGIPDIRLFWSDDPRFLSQFKEGQFNTKFHPFSKFPPCYKDVSFWLPDAKEGIEFHINEVYEVGARPRPILSSRNQEMLSCLVLIGDSRCCWRSGRECGVIRQVRSPENGAHIARLPNQLQAHGQVSKTIICVWCYVRRSLC